MLPLGEAGVNIDEVAPTLRAIYEIGGYSFGLLTLLAPITLLASALWGRFDTGVKKLFGFLVLLAALTSVAMDLQHLAEGINNPVNLPPEETLILISATITCLLLACVLVAYSRNALSVPIILMLATEILGLLYLFGNVATANYGVWWGSKLGGYDSALEPYFGTLAGLWFALAGGYAVMKVKTKTRYFYVVTLIVGAIIEYLVMANVLAGSSIVLGTIIIYDFGFLGVTNSNVVFLVFAAISSFITGWFVFAMHLKSKDQLFYFGFAGLVLVLTGLVFVSETVTTYILLPLVAATILVSNSQIAKESGVKTSESSVTKQLEDLDSK